MARREITEPLGMISVRDEKDSRKIYGMLPWDEKNVPKNTSRYETEGQTLRLDVVGEGLFYALCVPLEQAQKLIGLKGFIPYG